MSQTTNTPTCPTDALLLRLAYRELDADVEGFLSSHLESCDSCGARLEDIEHVGSVYDSIAHPKLPRAAFRSMVRDATRDMPQRSTSRGGRIWVQAAAVIAVAFTTGLLVERTRAASGSVVSVEQRTATDVHAALTDPSAAMRLRGVSLVSDPARAEVRSAALLIWVLETDPSPNVRLAAVDALRSADLGSADWDRVSLVLTREPRPALRMAVIDLLVALRPEVMAPALERAAEQDEDAAVRRRASIALELT